MLLDSQPSAGSLIVDFIDRIFKFNADSANRGECSPPDANSLAKGIFSVAAVGFSICFLFYCVAHCTYPKDRRRVWLTQKVEG